MGGSEVKQDEKGRTLLSSVPLNTPINIICHQDDVELTNDRADVMEIWPEDTIAMAAKFTDRTWELAKKDEDFKSRLVMVFPDIDIATDPRKLADYPLAIRHVVGLIVCMNKAINTGKSPFIRYPETYLHPSSVVRVTQLILRYTNEFFTPPKATESEDAPE